MSGVPDFTTAAARHSTVEAIVEAYPDAGYVSSDSVGTFLEGDVALLAVARDVADLIATRLAERFPTFDGKAIPAGRFVALGPPAEKRQPDLKAFAAVRLAHDAGDVIGVTIPHDGEPDAMVRLIGPFTVEHDGSPEAGDRVSVTIDGKATRDGSGRWKVLARTGDTVRVLPAERP